ncbi:MAG: GNAT family N-acetyltransferase [Thermoanaerobaculia bacterium]|nr:GNAT family N-acetyltransferase [Thermoanaerobaculia bacterium]
MQREYGSPPAGDGVLLRTASPADLPAIERLCRRLDPADYGLSTWRGWLHRADAVNRVAVVVERVVGCFHGRAVAPGQAFVQVLRVDPEWRRKGVGSQLVEAVERGLAEGGVGVARCTTGDRNRAARRLFAAAGYEERLEIHRLRRRGPPPERRAPAGAGGAVGLARRHGLLAGRRAPAHYLRVYWEPVEAELAAAVEAGRLVAADGAVGWLEPAGPRGLWLTAVAGPERAVRRLVARLPTTPALTVDAPAALAGALGDLGFGPPGPDDRYVLLEKRLTAAG